MRQVRAMADERQMLLYHARPYTAEARAVLPLFQAGLVTLAALIALGVLGQIVSAGSGAGERLMRLAYSSMAALLIGSGFLIWLVWRATKPDVAQYIIPTDLDRDGQVDDEEADAAEYLFTENGLVEFAERVFFEVKDWRAETLVPGVLSREMYNVLIGRGGIMRTVGVLGEAGRGHTPPLLATSPAEAEGQIRSYLRRPQRRVWTLDIQGRGGMKRVVV